MAVAMRVAGLVFALSAVVACTSSTDSAPCCGNQPIQVARTNVARVSAADVEPAQLQRAVAANNAFALALLGQMTIRPSAANLLISPLSASLALTMAYAGANGETKGQMASALALPADGSIFTGQNALGQALDGRAAAALAHLKTTAAQAGAPAPDESDYRLNVVSSVWGQEAYPWQKPFLDVLSANYGTGILQQDFVHAFELARITIDDWVSSQTNAKINGILERGTLDEGTRLVIVNALYLKLPWEKPFLTEQTKPDYFDDGGGSSALVDYMHTQADLTYQDDGRAQVLALPLANRELSVLIALPHADVSLAEYEAALSAGDVELAIPKASAAVALSLPKVSFTSPTTSLSEPLRALGMHDAFDPSTADFSALSAVPPDGGKLYVSDVLQKSMFTMQEQGIEAAAATAVVLGRHAADTEPPVQMEVRRPFVIAIVDQPTGAVLMLGHVKDPGVSGGP